MHGLLAGAGTKGKSQGKGQSLPGTTECGSKELVYEREIRDIQEGGCVFPS